MATTSFSDKPVSTARRRASDLVLGVKRQDPDRCHGHFVDPIDDPPFASKEYRPSALASHPETRFMQASERGRSPTCVNSRKGCYLPRELTLREISVPKFERLVRDSRNPYSRKLSQCRKLHGIRPRDPAWDEISFSAVERSNRRSGSVIALNRASKSRSRGVSDWVLSRGNFFSCLLARIAIIPPCFAYWFSQTCGQIPARSSTATGTSISGSLFPCTNNFVRRPQLTWNHQRSAARYFAVP